MSIALLPEVNATLNGISAILLTIGWLLIRQGRWRAHRRFMIAAFVTSSLFLTSYVVYHLNAGVKLFPGTGVMRVIYFSILIPHVILAMAVLPLAIVTLSRGLSRRFDRHRAIARWTLPIWLYVSVTGVIVYVMLYRMY